MGKLRGRKMKVIINKIDLKGFKKLTGVWKLSEGGNTFLGKNGTGKTTLCDAERWLRTGKNSAGNAVFDIKTIVEGRPISKHTHAVAVTYSIDGEPLMLERSYAEKWAKKRGSLNTEFSGHTTTYRINDQINVSKKYFDAKVAEFFGGEKFKLTSDPTYFAGLKW